MEFVDGCWVLRVPNSQSRDRTRSLLLHGNLAAGAQRTHPEKPGHKPTCPPPPPPSHSGSELSSSFESGVSSGLGGEPGVVRGEWPPETILATRDKIIEREHACANPGSSQVTTAGRRQVPLFTTISDATTVRRSCSL
ncbi:hypothetical protein C0Q70_05881 [Pomacea canaliculata]|uniref:Uncharacterized protein n=1 Tax=Pomacea canaliculata TaxID=400727 RepID=A0A2T7PMF9_POMCA|nr:hypothetical protein C0Q70_05881 [Pomacea canaliculata]